MNKNNSLAHRLYIIISVLRTLGFSFTLKKEFRVFISMAPKKKEEEEEEEEEGGS